MILVTFGRWLHLEFRIVDHIIDLDEVFFEIILLGLVDKFEELEVENSLVRVGLIIEEFNGAVRVDQIILEKWGVFFSLGEDAIEWSLWGLDIILQFAVFPLIFVNDSFHLIRCLDIEINSKNPLTPLIKNIYDHSNCLKAQFCDLWDVIEDAETTIAEYWLFRVFYCKIKFTTFRSTSKWIIPSIFGGQLNTSDLVVTDPKNHVLEVVISIESILNWVNRFCD